MFGPFDRRGGIPEFLRIGLVIAAGLLILKEERSPLEIVILASTVSYLAAVIDRW